MGPIDVDLRPLAWMAVALALIGGALGGACCNELRHRYGVHIEVFKKEQP